MLITGGTGSLGNALVARFLDGGTYERIIVYSRDEWKQAQMAEALGVDASPIGGRVRFFLGDVRDRERLKMAFHGVDVVVHCAALKRVDAIAYNPTEVMRTNVQGTHNVCLVAADSGVKRVVFISSDKGVEPTNIYGTSKQFGEHLTVAANVYGYPRGTRYACLRYGNVMGSRGSVILMWRAALRAGMSLRLTSPLMTRFWITLAQATQVVEWTLANMRGGEIVVPVLPAASLIDLAAAMNRGSKIEVIGPRPGGEKMDETLLSPEERTRLSMPDDGHYIVLPVPHTWTAEEPWPKWVPREDFEYTSRTARRLSVDELKALLREIP